MELSLDILLYFIAFSHPHIAHRENLLQKFVGANYFYIDASADALPFQSQYLYVAELSALWENKSLLKKELTILAVQDISLTESELQSIPCDLILVDTLHPSTYLLNHLINVFGRIANWDKNMHIAVLEATPLQELIHMSDSFLEYPIIVFDASFDVLAYTQDVPESYKSFHKTIRDGYTDTTIMNEVRKHNIFMQLKNGEPLVAPAAGAPHQTNIYFSFSNGQTLLGYVCLFHVETHPHPGYLELLKLFTENLNFCLRRDYENHRFGQMMSETMLSNLMNPDTLTKDRIIEQLQNIENLPLHSRFVLGVISFGSQEKVPITFLARMLERQMWDVRPYIYQGQICLLNLVKPDRLESDILQNFEKKILQTILENYQYTIGISNIFYDITDLRFAYIQANAAIHFGQKSTNNFSLYRDHYYSHLLQCMDTTMPVRMLQPEFYTQLKEFDEKNNTSYRDIILTYLEKDCNATHAASQLGIHRNTVRNVVQYMEEHWQISIADTKIKKLFILSHLVDEYMG